MSYDQGGLMNSNFYHPSDESFDSIEFSYRRYGNNLSFKMKGQALFIFLSELSQFMQKKFFSTGKSDVYFFRIFVL